MQKKQRGWLQNIFASPADTSSQQRAQNALWSIDRNYAYIEFDLQGQIQHANSNFLALMGYQM